MHNANVDNMGGNPRQIYDWFIKNQRLLGNHIAEYANFGKEIGDGSVEKRAQGLFGQDSFEQIVQEIRSKQDNK